ncbi:hypothetical protein ACJJID_05190 [Microbulbifer sp. CnH-101-G]|uniref:hypothetical protein n=1 Tax=Microbulbifer sp. CnH-101-G TaxID=3243393 RepID=UPI00403A6254
MSKVDLKEIVERLKVGVLCRDFSGRLCYEINDLPLDNYKETKRALVKKFELCPFGITIYGLDEVFQSYMRGFKRVGIEWDVWSGFTIVAKSKRAENLVINMARYLESTIKM